jgi:hypothetical protein
MYDDYYDERDERLATPQEAVSEFAWNAGAEHAEQAWLLHDWDVWVKNPHYSGPPVPHPESDPLDYEAADPGDRPYPVDLDDYVPF